jgi:hypothetical protein
VFDPRLVFVGFVVYKVAAWHDFLQVLRVYHLNIITPVLLSCLYLRVVLTRRTDGPNLVTFNQNNAVPGEGREFDGKMLSLISLTLKVIIDIVI